MTDFSAIADALKASLNPDATIRQGAQAALEAGCSTPGALFSLMNLAIAPGVPQDVALAGAVLFKNEIKKRWSEGITGVSDGEKQVIKQHIIQAVCSSTAHLRSIFIEAMHRICLDDYPSQWPAAIEECGVRFAAANFASPESFIAPLQCLLLLAKVFQYKPEDQRAPVEALCAAISPALLLTLQQSLQQPFSPTIAEIQLIISKIFWSLTMFSLPNYFRSVDTFGMWLQAMLALSSSEAPPAVAVMAPEDAWKSSWWRLRKRTTSTLDRLLRNYLMPSKLKEGPARALAAQLEPVFTQRQIDGPLQPIVHRMLEFAFLRSQGRPCSPRVLRNALSCLENASGSNRLWPIIKPHAQLLLTNVVMPELAYKDDDAELWREDPQEYVRLCYDMMEDYYSPRSAASECLSTLCKARRKTCLPVVLSSCASVMQLAASAPTEQNARHKFAVHAVLLAVKSILARDPDAFGPSIHTVVAQHVIPDFQSPFAFLRGRACEVVGEFIKIGVALDSATAGAAVQKIVQLLTDPELPVRIFATTSLAAVMDDDDVKTMLQPHVSSLLGALFTIIQQVISEETMATLATIIKQFPAETRPHSVMLIQGLVPLWQRFADASLAADDDDQALLCMQTCMGCILEVAELLVSTPEVFPTVEPALIPLIVRSLDANNFESHEDGIQALKYLLHYSPAISPALWNLFPLIVQAYSTHAVDYLTDFMGCFENYIARGTAEFIRVPDYCNSLVAIARRLLCEPSDYGDQAEARNAAKIAELLASYCPAACEAAIMQLLAFSLQRLAQLQAQSASEGTPVKRYHWSSMLRIGVFALFSNTASALATMTSCGVPPEMWFSALVTQREAFGPSHKGRSYKFVMLWLAKLLQAGPLDQLPESLRASLGQRALEADNADDEDEDDDDDDDDDDVSELNSDDEDEGENADDDEQYAPELRNCRPRDDSDQPDGYVHPPPRFQTILQKLRASGAADFDDDDDDDDDDDEEDAAPIDQTNCVLQGALLDSFAQLLQTMHALSQSSPQAFSAIMAAAGADAQVQMPRSDISAAAHITRFSL